MTPTLSHVALAVPDLEKALAVLQTLFGWSASPIMENTSQGVRLAYLELGNTRIEVLQPTVANSPLARFLQRNPTGGIHHVSLSVPNLDTALAQATETGIPQAGATAINVHGERIAFLDPRALLGALFELEERPPE